MFCNIRILHNSTVAVMQERRVKTVVADGHSTNVETDETVEVFRIMDFYNAESQAHFRMSGFTTGGDVQPRYFEPVRFTELVSKTFDMNARYVYVPKPAWRTLAGDSEVRKIDRWQEDKKNLECIMEKFKEDGWRNPQALFEIFCIARNTT